MDYSKATAGIVQLNSFPKERYNVLVPVTTMQVASNLQKITVSEVLLDTRQNETNKGPSKDIYFERSCNAYAITKVGGMKLAAAANVSIVSTETVRTECCLRCIEMARATGKAKACGNCPHVYDMAVTVTIRVPEPSGGFRMMQATKEIDCTLVSNGMTEAQYKRFLPHRAAIAESKAFMRAIRAALGLAATYSMEDLKKPFVVARVVPNLDAPEIKTALANNYLASMGMLFELPTRQGQAAALPTPGKNPPEVIQPYEDESLGHIDDTDGDYIDDDYQSEFIQGEYTNHRSQRQPTGIVCTGCNQQIIGDNRRKPEDIAGYSQRVFGRVLCLTCQRELRGGI